MKEPLSIEDLEKALNIPSFEEELAMSDLPHRDNPELEKAARLVTCRICGTQTMVGPDAIFSCPNAPHDPEDDLISEEDIIDEDIPEFENEND